ncbi:hypothetical protein P2318_07880 [Myxococcaceae bacterium GXIMD 01537]
MPYTSPALAQELSKVQGGLKEFIASLLTLDIEEPWTELAGVKHAGPQPWVQPEAYTLVLGSLEVEGNVVVSSGKHDDGVLIVFGDIVCQNLVVGVGFSLVCTGSIRAREAIVSTAQDSITYVGGAAEAELLDSGAGAWLTLFGDPSLLRVKHLTGYVMHGRTPIKLPQRPNLMELVAREAIETEEWDSLSEEERAKYNPADLLRLDSYAVLKLLRRGDRLLLKP